MGLSPASQQVAAGLADAGLVVDIRTHPEGTRTAQDAARAIGCDVGAIVQSLVLLDDADRPVLVLCGGDGRVDAAALGLREADADLVRRATGFSIGGVPPIGHFRRLTTLIDRELLRFEVVWAAAGTATSVFSVTPADLVRVTRGEVRRVRAAG